MAKFCFPNLTDEYAAIVSTHGYFEIQKKESYNSYKSNIGPVKYKDGSIAPTPVVVYTGSTDELGIPYSWERDDLELDCSEENEVDFIQNRLLNYLKGKNEADIS